MSSSAYRDDLHPSSQFYLRVAGPSLKIESFQLDGAQLIVGRSPAAAIVLDSPKVSRHHAELTKDPFERWWVRDLGSRNGTKLNGEKITQAVFAPGDLLEIGGFSLTLAPLAAPREQSTTTLHLPMSEDVGQRVKRLGEYEPPRIEARHLSSLTEFGHQLNITQDARERLRQLCQLMTSPQFHGRWGMVLRVRRDQIQDPQVLCDPQAAPDSTDPLPPISRSALRAVCELPEPVLATNVSPLTDQIELSISPDVVAMTVMAAPIRFDTGSADLLYLVFGPEYGHSDWLALVALAVKQYQQAEAVWLHVEKIREYAAVARELELAQALQQRLIPRRIRIEGLDLAIGFRACHWVGGDYVDVVPMADGRVLLAIADVCGKGLPAALITSCVHTMVHAYLRAGRSVGEMTEALNGYLQDYLADGKFVTMVCLALDPSSGRFECINAGHPPGLIVGATGDLRQLRIGGNMPLGIGPGLEPDPPETLRAGDLLALFTDGLTEATNQRNQMLGTEGLGDYLQKIAASMPSAPMEELVNRVTDFMDGYEEGQMASDDRTFMLVRLGNTIPGEPDLAPAAS